jgi:hypothetical protein
VTNEKSKGELGRSIPEPLLRRCVRCGGAPIPRFEFEEAVGFVGTIRCDSRTCGATTRKMDWFSAKAEWNAINAPRPRSVA